MNKILRTAMYWFLAIISACGTRLDIPVLQALLSFITVILFFAGVFSLIREEDRDMIG